MTVEQFNTLQAQFDELREQFAKAEAARAEASAEAQKYREALDAANERVANLESKAQRKRFAELSDEWFGDKHVDMLVSLAGAWGEDSEEFAAYVTQQNAVAAQLKDASIFNEIGSNRQSEGNSAETRFAALQAKIATEEGVSPAIAMDRAASRNPELYAEYVAEKRG